MRHSTAQTPITATFFNEEGGSYLDALQFLCKGIVAALLVEGVSPLEFEDAFNALQEGRVSAFSWELSLRLALSQAKISIQYENGGFHVIDQNGARLLYRYDSSNAAERLFLKLLFRVSRPGKQHIEQPTVRRGA